jgi:hypothetical protein
MINQPEPVFSYTIPYYTSIEGEIDELFVSEKTYEKYLQTVKRDKVILIHGLLHPISSDYGEVITTLLDNSKAIIVVGIKDLEEYTSELLDISIAQELEKILYVNKQEFFRYLYIEDTPDQIKTFIDDIQQTFEEIHIAKRLIKEGYRIHAREDLLAKELLMNAVQFSAIRTLPPYESEHAIFLLSKLIYLSYVDQELFKSYKNQLQPHYPKLFIEADHLLKLIKKINLSTASGREKALVKIFDNLSYTKYVKKITINEIEEFQLVTNNMM